jgi:hypothetical protein
MTKECDCDFAPCGHDYEIEKGSFLDKMLKGEMLKGEFKVCKLLKGGTKEEMTLGDMKQNDDGSVECEMVYDGENFVAIK